MQCRKSRVIPLVERGGRRGAGLKIYSDPRVAERQAAGLRLGAAMSNFPGCAAPVLYAHDEDAASLLVEWVPAPHLEWVLVRAAVAPSRHRATLVRVGTWLRNFHSLSGIDDAPFDAARYTTLLAARIASAPAGARELASDAVWTRSLRWLESRLDRLDGRPVPVACIHGDFTFTNILVSPETVTGIDIWADRRLPLVEDLARMFVYLAMGDLFPLRARVGQVPLGERRAQQSLLEGYGGLDERSSSVWEAMVCFEAVARWLALSDRLARRSSPTELWKRAGVRGVLTSIVGRG